MDHQSTNFPMMKTFKMTFTVKNKKTDVLKEKDVYRRFKDFGEIESVTFSDLKKASGTIIFSKLQGVKKPIFQQIPQEVEVQGCLLRTSLICSNLNIPVKVIPGDQEAISGRILDKTGISLTPKGDNAVFPILKRPCCHLHLARYS